MTGKDYRLYRDILYAIKSIAFLSCAFTAAYGYYYVAGLLVVVLWASWQFLYHISKKYISELERQRGSPQ